MVLLATELAETTRYTLSRADMRAKVLSLYRRCLRSSAEISEMYALNMATAGVRTKIRQEFERQRFVSDIRVINIIYAKGQMEFQETLNFWKQECHVMRYFQEEENYNAAPNSFMEKFLKGNA